MTQRPIGRGERVLILGAIATLGLSMLAGGRRAPALPRAAAAARHAAPGAEPPTDRGRTADSPADIPPRGWWSILKRVAVQVSEDRVMAEAASVTYYALLAIFPTLAALVSLYGLVADPNALSGHLSAISGVVPGGGMQIITEQVKRVASAGNGALGFGAIIGLLVSIWSANAGIKSMFEALNAVYDEHEARSFVRRTLLSLAFTLGAMAFVLLAMGAVVVLPVVLNVVGLGSETETLLRLARWPLLLVAVTVFLAFLYRFGPSRAKASWRWVSWGGGLAAIGWIVVSLAFSYYVQHFGSFNRTYGSLGAAIGFMTWIWISAIVVLIGAELNAEMEHQTARDTTSGPARPRGARGAVKADSVAA